MENYTDNTVNQRTEDKHINSTAAMRSETCNNHSLSTLNTKMFLTTERLLDQRSDQCSLNSLTTLNTQVMQASERLVEGSSQQWNLSENVDCNAKIKIFTSVMLHAWRQRRADVRRLQQIVENLQLHSIHSKNDLRVSNTLMNVEKNRCKELQVQLRDSTLSINKVRHSCEELTTTLGKLQAEKAQLEHTLSHCKEECKEMERRANDSKQDLLHSLLKQHGLEQQLSKEQSHVEKSMRENAQLLDEASKMRILVEGLQKKEDSYLLELNQKNEEIVYLRSVIDTLDQRRRDLNVKGTALLRNIDERKRTIGAALGNESELTRKKLIKGLQYRPKSFKWNLIQLSEEYGIFHILTRIHYYTAKTAYFLWLLMLPHNSLRHGCMPLKQSPNQTADFV